MGEVGKTVAGGDRFGAHLNKFLVVSWTKVQALQGFWGHASYHSWDSVSASGRVGGIDTCKVLGEPGDLKGSAQLGSQDGWCSLSCLRPPGAWSLMVCDPGGWDRAVMSLTVACPTRVMGIITAVISVLWIRQKRQGLRMEQGKRTFESSGCSPWVKHTRGHAFNLHDVCQCGGTILSVYTEGKLRPSRDLSTGVSFQSPEGPCLEWSLSPYPVVRQLCSTWVPHWALGQESKTPSPWSLHWAPLSPFRSCDINEHKGNWTASHTIIWGEVAVTNNLEKINHLTYKENYQLTIREPRSYPPSSRSLRWGSQPCLGAPFPPRGLDWESLSCWLVALGPGPALHHSLRLLKLRDCVYVFLECWRCSYYAQAWAGWEGALSMVSTETRTGPGQLL